MSAYQLPSEGRADLRAFMARPDARTKVSSGIRPPSVAETINSLRHSVTMMEQRSRTTLHTILLGAHLLVSPEQRTPTKQQALIAELQALGFSPEPTVAHALMRAIFRPSTEPDHDKARKYARALLALRGDNANREEASKRLWSPGIDALASSIAERSAPSGRTPPSQGTPTGSSGRAAFVERPTSYPRDVSVQMDMHPNKWINVQVRQNGRNGKPMIRSAG